MDLSNFLPPLPPLQATRERHQQQPTEASGWGDSFLLDDALASDALSPPYSSRASSLDTSSTYSRPSTAGSSVHNSPPPAPAYACSECSFVCHTLNDLRRHDRLHDPISSRELVLAERHSCTLCPLDFGTADELLDHSYTHGVCSICDAWCGSAQAVIQHMSVHRADRTLSPSGLTRSLQGLSMSSNSAGSGQYDSALRPRLRNLRQHLDGPSQRSRALIEPVTGIPSLHADRFETSASLGTSPLLSTGYEDERYHRGGSTLRKSGSQISARLREASREDGLDLLATAATLRARPSSSRLASSSYRQSGLSSLSMLGANDFAAVGQTASRGRRVGARDLSGASASSHSESMTGLGLGRSNLPSLDTDLQISTTSTRSRLLQPTASALPVLRERGLPDLPPLPLLPPLQSRNAGGSQRQVRTAASASSLRFQTLGNSRQMSSDA